MHAFCKKCGWRGLMTDTQVKVPGGYNEGGCPKCGAPCYAQMAPAKLSDVKPLVIIESPYAGDIVRNVTYARACIRDSIMRGEAPFGSHLLYTQPGILRDEVHEERELGMGLGWHIMRRAQLVAVYTDLHWSSGMKRGKEAATEAGVPVEERRLAPPGQWQQNWELQQGSNANDHYNLAFPRI